MWEVWAVVADVTAVSDIVEELTNEVFVRVRS